MAAERDLVDVEALLVAHLEQDAALGALVGGTGDAARVSTELPASFPPAGEARVQVFRVSSTELDPETGYLERAVVQAHAYGATKGEAWDVMAKTVRALRTARAAAHTGAVVTSVERVTGPAWNRDPSTGAPRYSASFAVTVHPTA